MNEIGAYDHLSMTGLRASWFDPVPVAIQERLISVYPDFRLIQNPVTGDFVVVCKDPLVTLPFADGYLQGWSIATNFPGRLDAEQIIGYLRSHDKWNDEYLDKWAPKSSAPPEGETIRQRTTRADNAAMEDFKRQRTEQSHRNLDPVRAEFMDRVRVATTSLQPMCGARTVSEWLRIQRMKESSKRGRVMSKPMALRAEGQ